MLQNIRFFRLTDLFVGAMEVECFKEIRSYPKLVDILLGQCMCSEVIQYSMDIDVS